MWLRSSTQVGKGVGSRPKTIGNPRPRKHLLVILLETIIVTVDPSLLAESMVLTLDLVINTDLWNEIILLTICHTTPEMS